MGENGQIHCRYLPIKHLLRTGTMMVPLAEIRKSEVWTVLGGNNNKGNLCSNAYHVPWSCLIFIFGKVGIIINFH